MNPNYTDIFGRLNYNDKRIRTVAHTVNNPLYKVYTALLTQNGDETTNEIYSGNTVIGVTYQIVADGPPGTGYNFTVIGAPNNNQGTAFVATGTTPIWGTDGITLGLASVVGAPTVKVLENTIGNIWFTYNNVGDYVVQSNELFTLNKTFVSIGTGSEGIFNGIATGVLCADENLINIQTANNSVAINDELFNTPFEIRVYN